MYDNQFEEYEYNQTNISTKKSYNLVFPSIFWIFFLVFTLVTSGLAIGQYNTSIAFSNAPEIEGIITYKDYTTDDEGDRHYRVYVTYEVDGIEYKNVRLNTYNSSMVIGTRVTFKYLESDPSSIYVHDQTSMILNYAVPGVFFTITFILGTFIIVFAVKNSKLKKLIHTGIHRRLRIMHYDIVTHVTINKSHPYYIVVIDSNTNFTYRTSKYFLDPYKKLPINYYISIYFDQEDKSIFYIDVNSASEDK
ncbi:MAG: DUF3592 domain-containing protein [bacterium]